MTELPSLTPEDIYQAIIDSGPYPHTAERTKEFWDELAEEENPAELFSWTCTRCGKAHNARWRFQAHILSFEATKTMCQKDRYRLPAPSRAPIPS